MELLTTKTKEELLEIVYSQRVHINKLELDLEKEKAQIDAIVEDIVPIANEIEETKGLLRVFKIAKLAIVLVQKIVEWVKQAKNNRNAQ